MIPRKATTAIFLFFTVVVAFNNFIFGQYQYILLTLPFLASMLMTGKASKAVEIFGILLAAMYVMAFQIFHVGLMGMIVAASMFFTLGLKYKISRLYIYANTAIVFACSYFQWSVTMNRLVRSSMDAGIYFVCAFCIHISISNYAADVKDQKPLDEKCIDALEESQRVARAAINLAKKGS